MQKTVLITGGSRGMGKATAELFKNNGYEVLVPSRKEMDLENPQSIEKYCAGIHHPIYAIINNAGINTIAPLDNLTDDIFEKMLQVNLKAPVSILRNLKEKMPTGRIVNISSIWSVISKQGRGGYSAVKAALNSITRTLALELAPNILINSVAPGFVNTELTQQNNTEEEIKIIENQIPLLRLAETEEIARVVFFLASEQNTYITGQTIIVDGGYVCK
ncbi:MAG: SDR family oxidoreductase [Prevotellaceae bacterium]|jgi:3-oxoacyl-[acyl-carrier protein] reductase|nr:SDR family oxidoreductase [Prevotellaceae bacterium]